LTQVLSYAYCTAVSYLIILPPLLVTACHGVWF